MPLQAGGRDIAGRCHTTGTDPMQGSSRPAGAACRAAAVAGARCRQRCSRTRLHSCCPCRSCRPRACARWTSRTSAARRHRGARLPRQRSGARAALRPRSSLPAAGRSVCASALGSSRWPAPAAAPRGCGPLGAHDGVDECEAIAPACAGLAPFAVEAPRRLAAPGANASGRQCLSALGCD